MELGDIWIVAIMTGKVATIENLKQQIKNGRID